MQEMKDNLMLRDAVFTINKSLDRRLDYIDITTNRLVVKVLERLVGLDVVLGIENMHPETASNVRRVHLPHKFLPGRRLRIELVSDGIHINNITFKQLDDIFKNKGYLPAVLTTSRGVLTAAQAHSQHTGGIILVIVTAWHKSNRWL